MPNGAIYCPFCGSEVDDPRRKDADGESVAPKRKPAAWPGSLLVFVIAIGTGAGGAFAYRAVAKPAPAIARAPIHHAHGNASKHHAQKAHANR